nr:hypothetical protein [uncultured Rhodococcus sp.]
MFLDLTGDIITGDLLGGLFDGLLDGVLDGLLDSLSADSTGSFGSS